MYLLGLIIQNKNNKIEEFIKNKFIFDQFIINFDVKQLQEWFDNNCNMKDAQYTKNFLSLMKSIHDRRSCLILNEFWLDLITFNMNSFISTR